MRWYRSLPLRVAVLIAAAVLAFDWLQPHAYTLLRDMADLPDDRTHFGVLRPDWIVDELFDGGTGPTPECSAALAKSLAEEGAAFVWINPEGVVIVGSANLPWTTGDRLPYPLTTTQRIELDGKSVPVTMVRVFDKRDHRLLGRMVTIILDEPGHAAWHVSQGDTPADVARCTICNAENLVLVDEEQFEQDAKGLKQTARLSAVLLSIALALVIGFGGAWFVTHRLRGITHQLAGADPDGPLPGPFDEGISDEVGVLAHTMNRMRAGIEQRDHQRREWVAQVSHDLRTPLTALIACLDRARDGMSEGDAATQLVAIAQRDAERVRAYAHDLLEIATIDALVDGVEEPVPAGELVGQVVESVRPWAEQDGKQVLVSMEPQMPLLQADGGRLLRALENLLRNALQHAKEAVRIAVTSKDDAIVFEVADDGPGFAGSAEDLGVEPSRGLGLVVVRRVVTAHGGTFGAENLPTGGSRFWFEIPLQR